MGRKWALGLCTAALLLQTSIPVQAAETEGSLRISLDTGELPVTNGAVTLYQAGTPVPEGYQVASDFGGGIVKPDDATSPHLARWLAESHEGTGKTVYLDVEGDVTFSNLEPGLYLAVQSQQTDGFHPFRPLLVTIPDDQNWNLTVQPNIDPIILSENPQTGQSLVPLLGFTGMVSSGMSLALCYFSRKRK